VVVSDSGLANIINAAAKDLDLTVTISRHLVTGINNKIGDAGFSLASVISEGSQGNSTDFSSFNSNSTATGAHNMPSINDFKGYAANPDGENVFTEQFAAYSAIAAKEQATFQQNTVTDLADDLFARPTEGNDKRFNNRNTDDGKLDLKPANDFAKYGTLEAVEQTLFGTSLISGSVRDSIVAGDPTSPTMRVGVADVNSYQKGGIVGILASNQPDSEGGRSPKEQFDASQKFAEEFSPKTGDEFLVGGNKDGETAADIFARMVGETLNSPANGIGDNLVVASENVNNFSNATLNAASLVASGVNTLANDLRATGMPPSDDNRDPAQQFEDGVRSGDATFATLVNDGALGSYETLDLAREGFSDAVGTLLGNVGAPNYETGLANNIDDFFVGEKDLISKEILGFNQFDPSGNGLSVSFTQVADDSAKDSAKGQIIVGGGEMPGEVRANFFEGVAVKGAEMSGQTGWFNQSASRVGEDEYNVPQMIADGMSMNGEGNTSPFNQAGAAFADGASGTEFATEVGFNESRGIQLGDTPGNTESTSIFGVQTGNPENYQAIGESFRTGDDSGLQAPNIFTPAGDGFTLFNAGKDMFMELLVPNAITSAAADPSTFDFSGMR
jgi:hypothetical protein